jgi:hypothetical protein
MAAFRRTSVRSISSALSKLPRSPRPLQPNRLAARLRKPRHLCEVHIYLQSDSPTWTLSSATSPCRSRILCCRRSRCHPSRTSRPSPALDVAVALNVHAQDVRSIVEWSMLIARRRMATVRAGCARRVSTTRANSSSACRSQTLLRRCRLSTYPALRRLRWMLCSLACHATPGSHREFPELPVRLTLKQLMPLRLLPVDLAKSHKLFRCIGVVFSLLLFPRSYDTYQIFVTTLCVTGPSISLSGCSVRYRSYSL